MKNPNKKRIKTITLVLIAILILGSMIGTVVHKIRGFSYGLYDFEVEDNFRKYKKDFDTLAKTFLERFQNDLNQDDNLSHILIYRYGENEFCFAYIYKDFTPSVNMYETMPEEVKIAYDNLYHNVFTKHDDNRISFIGMRVSKNQIAFMSERPYAIVYSTSRPKYIYDPDKEHYQSYFVDTISFHWYQVIGKL